MILEGIIGRITDSRNRRRQQKLNIVIAQDAAEEEQIAAEKKLAARQKLMTELGLGQIEVANSSSNGTDYSGLDDTFYGYGSSKPAEIIISDLPDQAQYPIALRSFPGATYLIPSPGSNPIKPPEATAEATLKRYRIESQQPLESSALHYVKTMAQNTIAITAPDYIQAQIDSAQVEKDDLLRNMESRGSVRARDYSEQFSVTTGTVDLEPNREMEYDLRKAVTAFCRADGSGALEAKCGIVVTASDILQTLNESVGHPYYLRIRGPYEDKNHIDHKRGDFVFIEIEGNADGSTGSKYTIKPVKLREELDRNFFIENNKAQKIKRELRMMMDGKLLEQVDEKLSRLKLRKSAIEQLLVTAGLVDEKPNEPASIETAEEHRWETYR